MRILTLNLFVTALLLLGATSASAFAVSMTARGDTNSLITSDTVTVDVFLDADAGITIFSVAVISSNPAVLAYDQAASLALAPGFNPCVGPICGGDNGTQPSYLLYTGGMGASYLIPLQTPAFLEFPTLGTGHVNINYIERTLGTTTLTGTGIYVASLVFHVVGDIVSETLSLAFTSSNVLQSGVTIIDPATIGLSAPILVPEPTTAMLMGLGILGLGLAARRRA